MKKHTGYNQAAVFATMVLLVVLGWAILSIMFEYLSPGNIAAGCGVLFLVPVALVVVANALKDPQDTDSQKSK